MNDAIKHLEEKIAHLEHHVTKQDKAMLELAEDLVRLRREVKLLGDRIAVSANDDEDASPEDERPPHY